jgi:uncharacterized cupin superfamily protein
MADMIVRKPSKDDLKELDVDEWGIWEKEPSTFSWSYSEPETCYILEGEAEVTAKDGKTVKFKAGDLVTFRTGLECSWKITKKLRKRYRFG